MSNAMACRKERIGIRNATPRGLSATLLVLFLFIIRSERHFTTVYNAGEGEFTRLVAVITRLLCMLDGETDQLGFGGCDERRV